MLSKLRQRFATNQCPWKWDPLFILLTDLIYSLITQNCVHYCLLILKNRQLRTRLLAQFTFNVLEEAINQNIVCFLLTNDKSKSRPKPQPDELVQG